MAIDFNNEKSVKSALEYVSERVDNFYLSTEYGRAWDRYVKRWMAFHRRTVGRLPVWRSQLNFASFFVAVNTLDAQFKAAHATKPLVFVNPQDNSVIDDEAKIKAQVQHFNLNYDLGITNFKKKLFDMYWYVGLWGTAVGREYFRTKQDIKKIRRRIKNNFGIDLGTEIDENITRNEYTATQVIHPLNFAHDVTKNSFEDSDWGSVRFELPITELYKMSDNPNYHQLGVKRVIKQWEDGEGLGFVVGQDTFYSERGNDDLDQRKNIVVVNEYTGTIRNKGNRDDPTPYYMLYVKSINAVLAIRPNPFMGHPYWKMMTYAEPDGPYGIGANDAILPINYWENSTVNQYCDYMNSALKFMYEVQPRNIIGGVNMLINGLPNGLLPLEEGVAPGASIKPLELNRNQMGTVESMLQLIEKAKQQYGASSNLRGRDAGSNADTATGISLLADREDDTVEAIQGYIDMGIKRGMSIKIRMQQDFFNEERLAKIAINGEESYIKHYPGDLGGIDYSYDIKRELGDTAAGKHMSFLRLITEFDQVLTAKGNPLPAKLMIDSLKEVGTALNIKGIDEKMKELEATIPPPPEIGGQQNIVPQSGAPLPAQEVQNAQVLS